MAPGASTFATGQIDVLARPRAERFDDTGSDPGVRWPLNRIALGMAGDLNRVRQAAGSARRKL